MYDDPRGIVVVAVIVFLLMTWALAYVIKKVLTRRAGQATPLATRTIPVKERPDELSGTTYGEKKATINRPNEENEVERPLEELTDWDAKTRFHKQLDAFLRGDEPPK